jgi:hypothetical protein
LGFLYSTERFHEVGGWGASVGFAAEQAVISLFNILHGSLEVLASKNPNPKRK